MLDFRHFLSQNNGDVTIPVVSISKGLAFNIDKINEELNLSLNESSVNPHYDWLNSQRVLSHFGIELPSVVFEDLDAGEEVVILNCEDTDYYFYYCFSLNDGLYESFATVTDESGLEELLSEE